VDEALCDPETAGKPAAEESQRYHNECRVAGASVKCGEAVWLENEAVAPPEAEGEGAIGIRIQERAETWAPLGEAEAERE
jgi:hypothetical protein